VFAEGNIVRYEKMQRYAIEYSNDTASERSTTQTISRKNVFIEIISPN